MAESRYGFLDRVLHRLALQFGCIAEMSFNLDQVIVRDDPDEIIRQRHVFIAGLARAGTTVLIRRFYATGLYRSLTYRDMPFVLAPNLWRRISSISKREIPGRERAHGDNLVVDADSPESFDEVFWRVFVRDEYLDAASLKPHTPSADVVRKYVCYVNAILAADSAERKRYLSKNNNNVLRLGAIHEAFPNALILIPFREPFQHAYSLLRQQCRFSELQARSGFTASYMTWLGHHEFGLDHRPFLFGGNSPPAFSTDTLDYWLKMWCDTYSWLEKTKPDGALFVCYEDLCTREEIWNHLAALADVAVEHGIGDPFKLSNRPVDVEMDHDLAQCAAVIHRRLVMQTRAQLS